ncbi:MAG: hypothetical protein R8G01_15760 [Ilumatobacteraceae bacterium]|nr:hypothetical protein [Ilumatobacteraceae bacterium]
MSTTGDRRPEIHFCGEVAVVGHEPFTIGRDADFVIDDDNRFLHRQFLGLSTAQGVWLLANVGSQLTATVSDPEGRLEAFVSPGAVLPLVFDRTLVRFTAGPTSYEFSIVLSEPAFVASQIDENDTGDTTVGRTVMTPDQLRLILALAEPALLGQARGGTAMPSSGEAAQRLGWTTTKFNRKLDNVCQKLAAQGVRGLHGEPGRLASNRRARLVEYSLAVRLVTRDDLALISAASLGLDGVDDVDEGDDGIAGD